MEDLPGDYIAGFVDGEGCFALIFRRDVKYKRPNAPVYFYWDIRFAIMLRADDIEILQKIKSTLDCGRISINKKGAALYAVQALHDLIGKVIPFFAQHPLRAKKRLDFELWKEAAAIFERNQRRGINIGKGERKFRRVIWNTADVERLKQIHDEMGQYKSKRPDGWKWLPRLKTVNTAS